MKTILYGLVFCFVFSYCPVLFSSFFFSGYLCVLYLDFTFLFGGCIFAFGFFEQFCPIKHWSGWTYVAANAKQWMIEVDEFESSRLPFTHFVVSRVCSTGLHRKEGCLFGIPTSNLRPQTCPVLSFSLRPFFFLPTFWSLHISSQVKLVSTNGNYKDQLLIVNSRRTSKSWSTKDLAQTVFR